jgi:hypothetical protein
MTGARYGRKFNGVPKRHLSTCFLEKNEEICRGNAANAGIRAVPAGYRVMCSPPLSMIMANRLVSENLLNFGYANGWSCGMKKTWLVETGMNEEFIRNHENCEKNYEIL